MLTIPKSPASQNLQLVEKVNDMAARVGCTPGQLALAWVHAQGDDVFPIPGAAQCGNVSVAFVRTLALLQ